MKKIIFLITITLFCVKAFTQDCGGVPCISNPNIIQDDIILCYQEGLDSNIFCSETIIECYKVCEDSYNTYSTVYSTGSAYSWTVIGGQVITTNNSGNVISVLWGSHGAGNVAIEEIDSNGCTQISSECVMIITKPLASISTIPSATSICQNTNIQFNAENVNSNTLTSNQADSCNIQQQGWDSTGVYAYDLAYFWDFDDGSTSIEQNPFHTYSSPGNYTISLIIANSCQCADTVTTTIQVVNTLGPEITTSCIGTICEGDTIEYCTNAILPSWTIEGGVLYNSLNTDNCINVIWDNYDNELNDGLGSLLLADLSSSCGSSESIMNISAVPTNPFITGEINPCIDAYQKYSFACIPGVNYSWQLVGAPWGVSIVDGWGTSEITVENLYTWGGASYQISLDISSSTLQCSFNQISLNIDILPDLNIYGNYDICDSSITSYFSNSSLVEWEVVNGTIQFPANPPYISSYIDVIWDQGHGSGVVKATPSITGIFCNNLVTKSINIKEIPQEPIDIVNDVLWDTLICPGETYLYTVDPTNTTSSVNATYNWSITGGTPTNHNGDKCVITWNSTGPYSIDVVSFTDEYPICQSVTFSKTINSLPLALPVISGSSIVCTNDRSDFEITNVYPNDAVITWEVSNASLGSVVSGQGSGNAIIEWGDQLGSTSIKVTVEICGTTLINTFPVVLIGTSVSFTFPGTTICPLSSVTFTASSTIGDFSWDFGDGNSTNLTNTSTVTHSYSSPGEYNVILTLNDLNQCMSVVTNFIEISGPVGHINPNPNSGIIEYCDGHTISDLLSVTTASNATPYSWEWYHDGILVQNGGSTYPITLTPPNYAEAGAYSVVLTDSNSCSNSTGNLNLNIVTCPVNSCNGGSCGICPNFPISHTFSCNTNIGTWDFNFSSTTGNLANFYISGTLFASNTINASYTFTEAGTYTICCYDLSGNRIGYQVIDIPFVVDWKSFSSCNANNNNEITMHFSDISSYLLGISGITYQWDFGDGSSSIDQNPIHTYTVPGIYTVNFTVSHGGQTCNKTQQIEVDFNTSFSYSGPECEETPTILFLSGFSPPNIQILSWQWDFDDGSTSARENPERTYSQSGLYNPSLLTTSINGCINSITIPLVIYSKPTITSLSSVNSFCLNDPQLDLSTLVTYSTLNGETAGWSGNGVVSSSGIYYFNPLLAGGGTHEICITITDINGCTDYQCINIIVICPEKPIIFGESVYCEETWNSQNLQTQSGFADYTWNIDGVMYSGPLNWASSIYFYESVGIYDITVSFLDDNGCTGNSEPFILQVHPIPNAVSTSSSGICPGSQINLTHTGSQSNVDYYWNTIPQQTGNSVNVIAEANYDYQVIAVNQFGCESISYNLVEIPNNVNMCNILSGCFCDSSIINTNGLIQIDGLDNYSMYSNYEWLQNGVSFFPPEYGPSLIIDPSNPNYLDFISDNISLSVSDYYGCSYQSQDLIIEPNCNFCNSTQSIFYVNSEICIGDTLSIGNHTYISPGNYIDTLLSTQNCDSIIHTNLTVFPLLTSSLYFDICEADSVVIGLNIYNSAGVYIDTLSSLNNCDSVIFTNINISIADAQINLIGNSLQLSVIGGIGPYTIEVGNQNGNIVTTSLNATSLSYNYNPIINGLYYFIVIDNLGCISDTIFYLVDIFPTLINEFGISILNIFPNPIRDVFNLSFTSDSKQSIRIRVLNIVGEIIFTEHLEDFEGKYTHSFNLEEYSKGVYLLELDTDNGIVNKKLILQ